MLIWSPSLQQNLKFKDLTTRDLLKFSRYSQEKNSAIYTHALWKLYQSLREDECSPSEVTGVDVVVAFLYLHIYAIGNIIKYGDGEGVECSDILGRISVWDRNTTRQISNLGLVTGFPTMWSILGFREYEFDSPFMDDKAKFIDNMTDELAVFIRPFGGRSYSEIRKITDHLDLQHVRAIKHTVDNYYFSEVLLPEDLRINTVSATEICRLLFASQSSAVILSETTRISKTLGISSETTMDMIPKERSQLIEALDENQTGEQHTMGDELSDDMVMRHLGH